MNGVNNDEGSRPSISRRISCGIDSFKNRSAICIATRVRLVDSSSHTSDSCASLSLSLPFQSKSEFLTCVTCTMIIGIEIRYMTAVDFQNNTMSRMAHPTYAIDLIWHTHMLHPQEYLADCSRLLGTYVSHSSSLFILSLSQEDD